MKFLLHVTCRLLNATCARKLVGKLVKLHQHYNYCVPVVSPWHHIGIDFIGPISPPSTQGLQYILTVADYFTSLLRQFRRLQSMPRVWHQICSRCILTHVQPQPDTTHFHLLHVYTQTCEFSILQLFMRMGIPKVITSDQGSEFNNKLNGELMERLQINHRLTTPYHPQVSQCYTIHLRFYTMYLYRPTA